MQRFVGWFQIVMGLGVAGLWVMLIVTDEVPEITAGQVDIWFHLAAELLMAGLLLAAGAAVLRSATAARVLSGVALGALTYSVVNSAGYYAEAGEWAAVAGFGVLLVLAVTTVGRWVLTSATSEPQAAS